MRLLPKTLLLPTLTLLAAGFVLAGPNQKPVPAPSWKIQPYKLVTKAGVRQTLTDIAQHGEGALMFVESEDDSYALMYTSDGTPEPVNWKDGKPVKADFFWFELRDRPAIVEVKTFDPDVVRLALVTDNTAVEIVDTEGKPVGANFSFRTKSGRVMAQPVSREGRFEQSMYVLIDNVLHAVKDTEGKHLQADVSMITIHPDGRQMLERFFREDDEFNGVEPHWLEGAKATPVKQVNPPADWKDRGSHNTNIFFSDYTLVVAAGSAKSSAWIVREGKYEPLKDANGKVLKHEGMYALMFGMTCYLLAADFIDHPNKASEGHVYRVEGALAHALKTPERAKLGAPVMLQSLSLPIVVHESELSREEYWLVDGDEIKPIFTEDGKPAQPNPDPMLWQAGEHVLLSYQTPRGYWWGRLEGDKLKLLCPADRDAWTDSCPFFEVDCQLFLRSEGSMWQALEVIEGGKRQSLKLDGRNVLEAESVNIARLGQSLYVSTQHEDSNRFGYIVRR
ncbi:MAG: hypothetical protein H6840_11100 [Planctomycetes bacterium]|nr:hypothetical protein [Planctomycetota bacterium]